MQNLPHPHPDALVLSKKLKYIIDQEIKASNGLLNFCRFMELCLYAPTLGYYSACHEKFGDYGDFITAPQLSPLFSQCLARQSEQILQHLGHGDILEFGAGTGKMASDILLYLAQQDCLPQHYFILEISSDLQQRQLQTLKKYCPEHLHRVTWLEQLPEEPFNGVILANEVVDAMPVHRFSYSQGKIHEYGVAHDKEQYAWALGECASESLTNRVTELCKNNFSQNANYSSEINLLIPGWIKSLSQILHKGAIIIIDYGFPECEYYHPQRSMGTLMCHYQHRAHDNPLILPGLQDITAHVDFTQIANSALENNLEILGYTTQAYFLLGCEILELAMASTNDQLITNQAIKRLTLPHEMGELFKVIALGRGIELPSLLGFSFQDLRGRL